MKYLTTLALLVAVALTSCQQSDDPRLSLEKAEGESEKNVPKAATQNEVAATPQKAPNTSSLSSKDITHQELPKQVDFPYVESIHMVLPDVLAIEVINGKRIPGDFVPYVAEPGDVIDTKKKKPYSRHLIRNGKEIGLIVGPKADQIRLHDQFSGVELNSTDFFFEKFYSISSEDDSNYSSGTQPTTTSLKSKPVDYVQFPGWNFTFVNRTTLYLHLPKPLKEGATYSIQSTGSLFKEKSFQFQPKRMRSSAVHVALTGFRPEDPIKFATLSSWLGTGGSTSYPEGLKFSLIDEATGNTAYTGNVVPFKKANEVDDPHPARIVNMNLTDTYQMDFSNFNTPGIYRVLVEGVGTSFPFPINNDVWTKTFKTSAKGMFFQRASIEVTEEFGGEFQRPLNFHPDMGKVAKRSNWFFSPLTYEPGKATSQGKAFYKLDEHATNEVVKNAWGGHYDAGDFDRRVPHLLVPLYYLELYRLNPEFFDQLTWNIPESQNNLPDILDESQWGLDVWKRLQEKDGGVPGWIESTAHPRGGETSWLDSLELYVTPPEASSSFYYAAAATRFASVVKKYDSAKSQEYLESAKKAFAYAEERFQKVANAPFVRNLVKEQRNLAALELYAATEDEGFHDLFLEHTFFTKPNAPQSVWKPKAQGGRNYQNCAAFAYLTLDLPAPKKSVRENARNALLKDADWSNQFARSTSNGFSKWGPSANNGWGSLGAPQALHLIRAYYVTKDRKYLEGAIIATQFMLGNNGDNMTFTTGLGAKAPLNPLYGDFRKGNLPVPPGLTVYGPWDNQRFTSWGIPTIEKEAAIIPDYKSWPTSESYLDISNLLPGHAEYTIQQTMAQAAYFWGAIAAATEPSRHLAQSGNN
ncbi:MAG: glycoside hydrolase family 9 protein [Verrucomicrobiota bacterium]